jgi:hypothetical protein
MVSAGYATWFLAVLRSSPGSCPPDRFAVGQLCKPMREWFTCRLVMRGQRLARPQQRDPTGGNLSASYARRADVEATVPWSARIPTHRDGGGRSAAIHVSGDAKCRPIMQGLSCATRRRPAPAVTRACHREAGRDSHRDHAAVGGSGPRAVRHPEPSPRSSRANATSTWSASSAAPAHKRVAAG